MRRTGVDIVEVIKDGKFVYNMKPGASKAEFTWVDTAPGSAESWYYVRVIQDDRNMAWSSPIWIDYSK